MSQIPIYHGGVKARGLADVPQGAHATAEAFGAGQARDMQNLAGALGNVNNAVLQIGLNKQARREETENRQLFQQANDAWLEQEKDWLENRKGMDAADLDKEAAQWWDDWKAKAETGITSTRQKDAFNRMFEGKRSGAQGAMWRYSVQQVNAASMASRDAENEGFIREAAAHGLMNDAYVAERRTLAHANIRANLRGQGEAVVQQAELDFDRKLHLSMIEAAAAQEQNGAGKALEYLNRDGVAEVLGAGMTKKLREQYRQSQVNNDINILAMDLADQTEAGAITSAEVQRLAYEKYPDDPAKPENAKLRETLLSVYDNHHARLKNGRLTQATKAKQALTERLVAADFDLASLPPEEQKAIVADKDLFQIVTRFKKWKDGDENKGSTNPDHYWIFQQEQMQPKEFKEWLNTPSLRPGESNFDVFLRKTGGKQEIINRLFKHALSEDGGAGGSGSGGGAGGSGAAKFDPGGFFENGYGALFETGVLWTAPESYLDDKTNTAKARRNGFLQFYNGALAEKEQELGRKANFGEQQEVAFQLMRAADEGLIDLDKPYWRQTGRRADGGAGGGEVAERVDVDVRTIPFVERRYNRGEAVQNLSPAVGSPRQNFGIIPPDDTRQLPPEIIDAKAVEVLRAYQAGRIGEKEYAADDFIVYDRTGTIRVFVAAGTQKSGRIRVVLPPDMDAVRVAAEEEELKAVRERAKVEQDINSTRNSRAKAERELQKIKDDAGESPGLATQRVIARREKHIQNLDKSVRSLRGEDVSGREAVVREEKARQLKVLTRERDELLERIRNGNGGRFANLTTIQDKKDLKKIEDKIKALEEEMK